MKLWYWITTVNATKYKNEKNQGKKMAKIEKIQGKKLKGMLLMGYGKLQK